MNLLHLPFQFAVVKVKVAGETVPSVVSEELRGILTVAPEAGSASRTMVNVEVFGLPSSSTSEA